MSTYTSEPGTRLAGRYRLVDQVSAGAGWTQWKATDETLARSVTVLTFAAGFPRVTETVTAARAASRLNDPRFSQVFDVEDADDAAYGLVVTVVGGGGAVVLYALCARALRVTEFGFLAKTVTAKFGGQSRRH